MRFYACLVLLVGCATVGARAQQPIETAGGRAQGMAGAFVAVADDATAGYWNPAGLATSGPASLTIEWSDFRKRQAVLASVGTWPVGITLARFTDTTTVVPVGGGAESRQLSTTQAGVTLLQTVVERLVVGGTVKWVHGQLTSGSSAGSRDLIDADLGLMVDAGRARVGFVVKNLRQPRFTTVAGISTQLVRTIRGGVSYVPRTGVTLALDVDLDTADLWDGPRRMIALGAEDQLNDRWATRAGLRWNVKDASTGPVAAAGLSARVATRWWLDVHGTFGGGARDRGAGVSLRAGF